MTIKIGSPPSDLPATEGQIATIRVDLRAPGYLGEVGTSTVLDTLTSTGVVGDTAKATDSGLLWELFNTPANILANWRLKAVERVPASQAEAEAGAENTKWVSSLRVKQAIDAQVDPTGTTADIAAAAAAAAAAQSTANTANSAAGTAQSTANAAQATANAAQPGDSDLTAIAALSTTAFGRALLEKADAAALTAALDADLVAIAALTTTAYGRAVLTLVDAAALTALLNVGTSALKGLLPPSGGGTTNFYRADGTFAEPPGGLGGGSAGTIEVNGSGGSVDRTAVTWETDPVNVGYTRVKTETIGGLPWTLQYDAGGKVSFREYVAGGLSVPISYNGAFGYVASGNYTDTRGIRVTPAQATSLKTQLIALGQAVQGLRFNVIGFESGGLGDVAVEWDAVTDVYLRISRASIAL